MSQHLDQSLHWDPSKLHFEFPMSNREARFKESVLYISDQCLDDPTYSKVKLFKILFYSDFEAFARYGTPITGVTYRKLPLGPAPAIFARMQEEMLRESLIRIVKRRVHDQERQRFLPLKEPNFELFQARDVSIIDGWIRFFWNMTSKEVSTYSHGRAWKLADDGDLIPYEAVFISDDPVTYDDVARVRELADQHKWKV
jgi:hypothetical protein